MRNVILPVYPLRPFTPISYDFPAGYLSAPDPNGRALLWGFVEACAIAEDFARKHPGLPESKSARGFAAEFKQVQFQIQTTPRVFECNEQQTMSVACGCTRARMYGAGRIGLGEAQAWTGEGSKSTAIDGYAFSNDNYDKAGNVSWYGVEIEDVPQFAFDALCREIRAGAHLLEPGPNKNT